MKKTLFSLILSLLLLVSLLASCNNGDVSQTASSPAVSSDTSEGEKVYVANVPSVNYDGDTFVILTSSNSATASANPEFGGDGTLELEMDTINTAVYNRNETVEAMLGIDIQEQTVYNDGRISSAMYTYVTNAISGNLCNFNVCECSLYDSASLAVNGNFVNLYSLEYLHNLEEAWWDQSFNDGVTIDGKLYFALGDFGYVSNNAIPTVMFNKEMAASNGIENLYELVRQKKWTIDVLKTYCKLVSKDVDKDGSITYLDEYGIGGQNDNMKNMFYGSGERIASIDDSTGLPVLTKYSERSDNVMTAIQELMQESAYYVNANDYFNVSGTPVKLLTTAFIENRSLFFTDILACATDLREMKVDFGILPMPLYDENQGSYYSLVGAWTGGAFAIPYVLTDDELEQTSIIMEVMGAAGKNIIIPAYYDIILMGQITRDDDSQEMLEIMFDTKGTDLGLIFKWGGYYSLFNTMISAQIGTFRSNYEQSEEKAFADIEATVEAFRAFG